MLSRKIILKYAIVSTLATAAFIIWLFYIRPATGASFKVVKLVSGYTSILVQKSQQGLAQSVLFGAGESFDIVRVLGETLPLFHNQIDYLILPSGKEDISGVTYVLDRFKVNTIIMKRFRNQQATTTNTVSNLMDEVGLEDIYKITLSRKIPVLFVRDKVTLQLGTYAVDLQLAGDIVATIKAESKPRVLLLGRTTKAQSRMMRDLALGGEDFSLILFQTLNSDNIDIDVAREVKPKNMIVSSFLQPRTKSSTKSKVVTKSKKAKKADYKDVDIERLLREEGIGIESLSELKTFRIDL